MENKVVLQVMGMDSSKYGGMERFNVVLSRALREKGFKAVFVYEKEPATPAFVDDLNAAGGEIVILNSRKSKLRFCKGFVKLMKRYRPVLVHAHFTKAKFYAVPIAHFMGVKKLFVTIHSTMVPKREIKPHTRLWCWWANKVTKVITVSDEIQSVYQSNWPRSEVRRIYLGVSQVRGDKAESRVKLGIPQEQTMLLTVSNFNHIKGLDVLCKAIGLLKEKGELNCDICLYIVGQPEADQKELDELIIALGIQDHVRMMGVSNEVPVYLTAADIYLQPSRNEGIGLALMEAASASLPLIGTKVGGIPEVVKDGVNGVLVPSEDDEAIATAIALLMHDESLRRKYGEQSRKVYQEAFCVNTGVERTIDYYGI